MAVKITQKDEKPMTGRTEVKGTISFHDKATPSNETVAKDIASQLKVDGKLVVVKHIYTSFGSADASVEALVYKTEEDLKRFEPVTKAMKLKVEAAAKKVDEANKAAEEAKAAPAEEAPKSEAKPEAEKPAEEKKEEAPKAEKPAEEKKE